jgi:hypothetical protein
MTFYKSLWVIVPMLAVPWGYAFRQFVLPAKKTSAAAVDQGHAGSRLPVAGD